MATESDRSERTQIGSAISSISCGLGRTSNNHGRLTVNAGGGESFLILWNERDAESLKPQIEQLDKRNPYRS